MIRSVLFDMDGVLVDSLDTWWYTVNDALVHFGRKKITKKDFIEGVWGKRVEDGGIPLFDGVPVNDVLKVYYEYYPSHLHIAHLCKGVLPILEHLGKKGIDMGIVTNTPKKITCMVIDHFDIEKYFDVVMSSDDVKYGKPDPEPVLKACDILKKRPNETIFVGDTKNDINAGLAAGCFTIGLGVEGGDRKMKDITELAAYF